MSGYITAVNVIHQRRQPAKSKYPQPSFNQLQKKLSGPELAEHIFEVNDLEQCDEDYNKSEDYSDHLTDYSDNDLGYQFELKLENPNDLIKQYREKIQKYERSYAKMADYALQWYKLVEDVNNNSQIEKMFKDLQMVRKLYDI